MTEAHLAAIYSLNLNNKNITTLKEGDFDGLTSLIRLSIGSNPFSSLPEGIFSGLTLLTWIDLGGNQISSLSADVFSGLSSLTTLILPANKLSSLPAGIFTGLSSLEHISLWQNQLSSLPAGIFTSLTSLTEIHLKSNKISSLPADVFSGLSSLTTIRLGSNQLSILPAGIFSGLSSLTTIELEWNQLNNLSAGIFSGLSLLTTIGLGGNQLSNLPTGLFSGLSSLVSISLYRNQLSSLPEGIFSGLSSLTTLNLSDNAAELSLIIELQQVGGNQFKAVIATGASFTIVVPLNVTNGSIMGGTTTATIPIGSVESAPFTVIPTPGTSDAVTLLIGTLSNLPSDHRGYTLAPFNLAPEFVEGPSTTRTVAEDIHTGGYIGTAVSATDPYNDPLTYTLSGADASSFAIDATTGQLRTSIQLDYETRSTYTVTVNVTDGTLTSSITVTINVTDVEPEALNVGEPRTVRLFYFLPNDRLYRADVVESMKTGILEVQSFYAEQMAAHGHGNMTFNIETDAQGDPIVHRIDADYGDSHYVNRGYTEGEIARAFDTSKIISAIVMDISSYPIRGQGTGNKSSGWLMVFKDWDWFTAAHELGHAFGLQHDLRDNTDILSYGKSDRSTATLSACAAEFLSVHPYFDSSIPLEIETRPTVELVSPTTYPAGAASVTIRVKVRDDSGLHQVMLFVRPNNPLQGTTMELKMWQKLDGETDTVVEFNFDGSVPSESNNTDLETHRTLANTNQHEIRVMAVDTEGNWFTSNFTLEEGVAQEILIPLSDRTPQVRDAIVAAVPGVNSANDVTAAHLAAITSLSVRSRDIMALRSGDFDGLTALTTLSVGGTKLSSLPAVVFDNLPTLTELYLGGNNDLNTLPAGIFDNLTALKKLYLNDNGMSSVRSRVFDNLTTLEELGLKGNDLRSLPSGIFDNLTALKKLDMSYNELVSLRSGVFDNNTALTELHLYYNDLNSLPSGIFDNNTALTTLTIWENNLSSLSADIFDNNTALTNLSIGFNNFSSLPSGIFEKLTNLIGLGLLGNQFRSLPNGIFNGLPTLTSLNVSQNPVDPLPLTVSLEKVVDGQFKAVAPTGAPFDIVLPLSITDGSISGGATTLTIPAGSVESETLTVTRTPGTSGAVSVWIGPLPSLPQNHSGYRLANATREFNRLIIFDDNSEQVWSGTVTGGTWGNDFGNGNATGEGYSRHHNAGSISNPTFTYRGTTYIIHGISFSRIGNNFTHRTSLLISPSFPACDKKVLSFGGHGGGLLTDAGEGGAYGASWYLWHQQTANAWPVGHQIPWQITLHPTVPDAPVATAVNEGNQVNLSWITPCDGGKDIIRHEYRQKTRNGAFGSWIPIPNSGAGGVNVASYTLTSVNNPQEHIFEVRAVNELGVSLPSAETIPVSAGFIPLSERTPQVRDAIVRAVPGINSANDVTEAHLAAITSLYLLRDSITTLKTGDFDGLTALTSLDLSENQLSTLPEGIFDDLTALTLLELHDNQFSTLPAGTFDGLSWLDQLFLQGNQLTTLPAGIFDKLTALRNLNLENNQLSSLPEGIFDKLTELNYLTLADNQLTTLLAGIFDGPSALYDIWLDDNQFATLPVGIFKMKASFLTLRGLYLEDNAVDPLPLTVSLEKVADGQFKAVAPAGATFDFILQISVANGTITGGATTLTIPKGSVESTPLTVTRTPGTTDAVSVDIRYPLPELPSNHSGYELVKSTDLPLEVIGADTTNIGTQEAAVNIPDPNLRTKIESALSKTAGDPITATEMATLTSLTAQDAGINDLTGLETATNMTSLHLGNNSVSDISVVAGLTKLTELQLWDNTITNISAVAGLTNLTRLYLWGNTISDISPVAGLTNLKRLYLGENLISNISVVVRLTNLTHLYLNENSVSDISSIAGLTNLTELRIGDNTISDISAVANLTNLEWLDMPNNSISDISAVANLTNLTSLMLTGNTISDISVLTGLTKLIELYFEENSISDLSPLVTNTGLGNNTEIYVTGNPLSYPSIYTHIPALQVRDVYIDFDNRVATALVKISGDTQQGPPSTALAQPFVVEVQDGSSVAFAGVPVTFAVTAGGGTLSTTKTTTDANGRAENVLTLGNTAGTNTVRVSVQGVSQAATFTAEATITNTAPVFTDGSSTTRTIAENTAAGINIGATIAATDANNDTLTYTLGGTDAASFAIDSTTGQLKTQAALDYETKSSYSVTVSVSDDNGGSDSITVTINVTDVNEQQTDVTTYEVDDEIPLPSGFNTPRLTMGPGRSLTADNGTYTCVSEDNCIIQNGQVTQGSIEVTTVAANTAPMFTDGSSTTRSIAENTAAGVSIGTAITATDTNNDILTYTLSGTEASAFSIDSSTGQLQTKSALDYETKRSYIVTITVSDGTLTDTISVTINVTDIDETPANRAPVFTEGASTTRTIAENTAAGVNIGTAVAATDADNDTLTYTLGGTDAASFNIGSTTGQLQTKASLDYETKRTYTVTITVSDGSLTDTITVTINITDVAETPVLPTLNLLSGRTPQVRDAIVSAIPGVSSANDVDEAHLKTITSLDLNDKSITSLKAGDFDGLSSLQTLYLANNQLTNLPPDVFSWLTALKDLYLHDNQLTSLPVDVFSGLSALRQINLHTNRLTTLPANVFSGLSSLTQIYLRNNQLTNLPPELFSGLSSLQYLYLDNNRFRTLPAGLFTGLSSLTQLLLNNNRLTSLPEGVFRGLTASTWLWLQGNPVDPLPLTISLEKVGVNQFKATVPAGSPFTIVLPFRVVNGAISGGANTLTISQGSVESGHLTVTRTSGTTAAVTVDIGTLPELPANHQGYQLTKSTDLPLEIISSPGNSAPVFTEGASTTRTIVENTVANVNIGTTIAATDADNDTLTYTLSGTDAASFSINSSTGQLQTKSPLDYETKTTYTVTITVSDGSLTDTIAVTINVTDADELPTNTGVCKVGDILAPGESCTYPGTDATFSVLDNGQAQWNIPDLPPLLAWINQTSIGGSLSISATINNQAYHFVAEEVSNDSWEIKEIGEDRPEQPETPETPEQPDDVGGTPTVTASTTAPLTETTLDESIVTLTLSGGTYHTNWGVLSQRVTVSGIDGVIVQVFNIERVGDTEVTVELTFDDTDFDTNSTLIFTVGAGAIANYDGTALTAQVPVTANTESVVASTTSPLTEDTLDGSVVTLTLSGRTYETSGVRIRNAVTASGIDGVTVGTFDIDRVSDTQVTVELTFDGNISTDGTLTFTVGPGAIAGYNGPALTTQVSVTASTETPTPTNTAPTFTAGSTTTRTVAENTVANVNVGSAVAATDANNDTLTYTLGGTDANVFSIESTTGQLKTRAALDYETKRTYTVTITVSDGNGGSDSITVTITVTNVVENRAPVFTDGVSTTRSVTENTAARQNIGRTISATDPNGDTLRYNLSGTEAASFRIDGTTGQLRTWAALDYETKRTYTVTVTVSDGSLTDTITVTINVTDVDDTPTLNVSTAVPLTEATLHGSVVTLTLSKKTYHTNWNFVSQNVEVSGITGVTFRRHNVVRVSDTKVTVELEFNGNISTNSTLTFTVGAEAIAGYTGPALTAQVPVSAGTESIVASTAAPLTEATLDESVVTLRVTGGIYKDNWNFVNRNVKVSGIAGVTFSPFNLDIESDTEITVELDFDGTDFDANSTLTFTVEPEAMVNYTGPALTAQLRVSSSTESLIATTAAPLTEATLDGNVVTLRVTGGTYKDNWNFVNRNVKVSGIAGVTFSPFNLDIESDTEITVELDFDGTDFDANSTLTFTVEPEAMVNYTGPALTAQIPVTANTESVVATTVSPLTEATLDERLVTLALNGANYERSIFDIRDAVTVSGIAGVTVGTFGVRRVNDTEVTVELEFDGTDFDTTSTLTFTVGADAIAGYNGPALTAQISVTANTESVVASTAAPLTEATLHESVVTLTLSGRTYERSIFRIRGAVTVSGIAGVTVGTFGVDRVSDTEVTVELEFNGNIDTDAALTFTVDADAIAGYNGPALTVQVPVTATEQVLRAPSGISLIHVPLKVTAVDGVPKTIELVGDLYDALGGVNTVNLLITYDPAAQGWRSYLGQSSRGTSADTVLTDNQGIIADMKAPVSLHLDGDALGSNGSSFITLHPGTNLVGVPLRDSRITRVSDLLALEGIGGNVSAITVLNNGTFQTVKQAGDVGDIPITGGQSFILNAWEETTVAISGQGWDNVSGIAAAAPMKLTGIQVTDTTPILALTGSIVSPVGGWGRIPHLRSESGFHVIVKNLSTGSAVATVIGDTGDSYQLTVVDTETGQAARIGDILEISVRSPNPLIGVQPLRYTVTAEDVRQSRIQLPELTVYEIPAETELLRNYPNPFNPETWIPYRLAEDAFVTLTIYDTAGRVVRSIDVGYKPAAAYESRSKAIYWDGRNEFGEQVASSVYFYHLSAGDYSATRKMLIVK